MVKPPFVPDVSIVLYIFPFKLIKLYKEKRKSLHASRIKKKIKLDLIIGHHIFFNSFPKSVSIRRKFMSI